jgi:hypothetical protein
MRRWILILAVSLSHVPAVHAQEGVADFYDQLAPYGTWLQTGYGLAWQPDPSIVGEDFVPYETGGQWVSTDQGWTFASDYEFGWAVFHYGRWFQDPTLGWLWLPDTSWAPAWVDWRIGGGYIGWAPLPPYDYYYPYPFFAFVFVTEEHFGERHEHRFAHRGEEFFRRTHPFVAHEHEHGGERHRWNPGPPPEMVRTARPVERVHVKPPPPGVVERVPVAGHEPRVTPPNVNPRVQPAPQPHVQPAPMPQPHVQPAPRPMPAPHVQPAPQPMPAPHVQPAPQPMPHPAPAPAPMPHAAPPPAMPHGGGGGGGRH